MKRKPLDRITTAIIRIFIATIFVIFAQFLFYLLVSCGPTVRTEWSDVLEEPATVSGRRYHGMETGTEIDTLALAFDGAIRMVPVIRPERFEVSFSCAHGGFTVERREEYETLAIDDQVVIEYREKYKITMDDEGKYPVSTEVVAYDYIRARPSGE